MGQVTCWRCGERITALQPWDLGHCDDDRSVTHGPECVPCNRGAAGPCPHPVVAPTPNPSTPRTVGEGSAMCDDQSTFNGAMSGACP